MWQLGKKPKGSWDTLVHTNLVHELLDPVGAKKEQAEDLAVLARVVDELGGSRVQLRARVPVASSQWARESASMWLAKQFEDEVCCVHVGEFVFLVETHRHTQVVLAEEEHIDARDGSDLLHL